MSQAVYQKLPDHYRFINNRAICERIVCSGISYSISSVPDSVLDRLGTKVSDYFQLSPKPFLVTITMVERPSCECFRWTIGGKYHAVIDVLNDKGESESVKGPVTDSALEDVGKRLCRSISDFNDNPHTVNVTLFFRHNVKSAN